MRQGFPAKSVKFTRRKFKVILVVAGLVLLSFLAFIWIAAGWLVSPPRRELQDYHREWLAHAAAHGIRVDQFPALDGKVPCLLVQPDAAHGPGERGLKLRTQLAAQGWKLDGYGTTCGTLVLLHGREGRKEDLLPVAERFAAAGFRCVLPDLPSHGDSPVLKTHFGTSPFESNLAADVLREAAARFHFATEPAGVWGMSMGGSFAVNAAAAQPQLWKAMVLVCTFDTLSGVERDRLHRWVGPFTPVVAPAVEFAITFRDGMSPGSVSSIAKAGKIAIPTLVAHGNTDALISLSRGRRLYDAFPGRDKKWIEVQGATHGTILVTPEPLYAEMSEWYLQWMSPRTKPAGKIITFNHAPEI